MDLPDAIHFVGPISSTNSLGVSARGFLARFEVVSTVVSTDWTYGFEQISKFELPDCNSSVKASEFDLDVFHINIDMAKDFSRQVESLTRSKVRLALPYWELSSFRPEWMDAFKLFDGFIAPTNFIRNAILPLTKKPVHLLSPLLKNPTPTNFISRHTLGISKDAYVFLYIFDVRSGFARKNPTILLSAFEAIQNTVQKDVHLVLKTSGDLASSDLFKDFPNILKNEGITLIDNECSESEIADLYHLSNCYVSPHRAEGLGLTLIEALQQDCALIYTKYSGSDEIPELPGMVPIEYRLVEIGRGLDPYQEFNLWAEPDYESLYSCMLSFAVNETHLSNEAHDWVTEKYFKPNPKARISHV
jgi:glycosyltransferase involved in cell wall biosynthesis